MLFYPPFKKKIQYLEVMNMEFVKGKKSRKRKRRMVHRKRYMRKKNDKKIIFI